MIHRHAFRDLAVLAFTASLVVPPNPAFAAGFSIPEVSTAGIGTANALVANPVETGAFPYNPAAMGFHTASSVSLGSLLIAPSFSVETATGHHDSQGADWLAVPLFQTALRLQDRWWIGLGISAPFGLETRWRDGTFPVLSGSVPVPRNHPTSSKLEILDFSPTIAFRVNETLSLSGGLDLYWAKSAQLDSTAAQLSGDGMGLGFNLSVLFQKEAWSIGAAFRSTATADVSGRYRPLSPTLVALKRLAPAQTAEVEVDLPWRLQIGVRYAFDPRLSVEFDWSRTGWSEFSTLAVKGRNSGALIFTDTNDWKDVNAYRFGVIYQVRPATQLRVGYSYDESAQDDTHFSARVPDNDRHLFGIGLAQSLGLGFSLEIGYMYAMADERRYRSATHYVPGAAINGSDAIDGDYAMDAHLIGLALVKTF